MIPVLSLSLEEYCRVHHVNPKDYVFFGVESVSKSGNFIHHLANIAPKGTEAMIEYSIFPGSFVTEERGYDLDAKHWVTRRIEWNYAYLYGVAVIPKQAYLENLETGGRKLNAPVLPFSVEKYCEISGIQADDFELISIEATGTFPKGYQILTKLRKLDDLEAVVSFSVTMFKNGNNQSHQGYGIALIPKAGLNEQFGQHKG